MRIIQIILFMFLLILVGVGAYFLGATNAIWVIKPKPVPLITIVPTITPTSTPVAKGNPASIYCTQVGGTLTIEKDGAGNEYGLCTFMENRSCEEWALYKGDCPVGGIKTTGYITQAQKYCAWLGGKTTTAENATCTFNDGSVCPDDALFNGTCQKGNK